MRQTRIDQSFEAREGGGRQPARTFSVVRFAAPWFPLRSAHQERERPEVYAQNGRSRRKERKRLGEGWEGRKKEEEEEGRIGRGAVLGDCLLFPINTDLVARFTTENVSSLASLAAPKLLKS